MLIGKYRQRISEECITAENGEHIYVSISTALTSEQNDTASVIVVHEDELPLYGWNSDDIRFLKVGDIMRHEDNSQLMLVRIA